MGQDDYSSAMKVVFSPLHRGGGIGRGGVELSRTGTRVERLSMPRNTERRTSTERRRADPPFGG